MTLTAHSETELIELPYDQPPDIQWEEGERHFFSKEWNTPVVTNVSVPTMTVHRPKAGDNNGAAVIVAPGGGLFALSIASEGTDVANWLTQKGFTVFVLKYRLVPTKENAIEEMRKAGVNVLKLAKPVLPLATQDGLNAIGYVRSNADSYHIDKRKIGFMGFSAGGAVTMNVTFNYSAETRPDFIVPVYAWMTIIDNYSVPDDAPPMLAICASDDQLGLASESVEIYTNWLSAKKSVALHMFAKGGHGFGMRKQQLASDHWIEYFHQWAITQGIVARQPNDKMERK